MNECYQKSIYDYMKRTKKFKDYMRRTMNEVNEMGGHGGKIDWNLPVFHFNNGDSFITAAFSVCEEQVRLGIIKDFKGRQ